MNEIIELTRHFGSIVGTPGISPELSKFCNEQLLRLAQSLKSNIDQALATKSGLIL